MRKDFEDFVRLVELRGKKKKPVRAVAYISGTMLARRNWRVSVREAALRGVTCVILYRKSTTNEVKRYEVIPTEYAYRKMKGGFVRKILWVQDVRDDKDKRQIKMFLCRNIIKAVLTDRKLKSRWPILIK
ncbi:MAG: hypothetical protein J6Y62_02085 [Clostridia bacterium]|nr:hypothetical protein [Clostridia bacterium]